MKIVKTELPGVLVIEPKIIGDERGFFLESYQLNRYAAAGYLCPSSRITCRGRREASCAVFTCRTPMPKANWSA